MQDGPKNKTGMWKRESGGRHALTEGINQRFLDIILRSSLQKTFISPTI
jgi:hypothetical protein